MICSPVAFCLIETRATFDDIVVEVIESCICEEISSLS